MGWPVVCGWLAVAMAIALNCSITACWVVLILMVLAAVLRFGPLGFCKNVVAAPFILPLAIFVACSLLSALVSGGLGELLRSLDVVRGFLVYPVAWQLLDNSLTRRRAFIAWLCVTSLAGFYAVIQGVFNFHPFTYPWLQATGFFSTPMPFSGVMQIAAMLSLAHLIALYRERGRCPSTLALPLLSVVFAFLGLLFAAERSAWLGMLFGSAALCARVSRKAFIIALATLTLGGALGYVAVPSVRSRVDSTIRGDVSMQARMTIWQRASEEFQKSPLTGVGPRKFPRVVFAAATAHGEKDLNHGHSNIMHLLATVGLLGVLAYLYVIATVLFASHKAAFAASVPPGINLGLMAAVVSLSAAGAFEYNFGAAQVRLALLFCLAFYRRV